MADIEFMHCKRFVQRVGITDGVLAGWIDRHWLKGIQYVVIGHQTLVHIERANQWIKEHGQLASGQVAAASKSGSGETGGSSGRTRTRRPLFCVPLCCGTPSNYAGFSPERAQSIHTEEHL